MFNFLKEKLKGAVSQFTEKIEEEGKEEAVTSEKKGFFQRVKDKFSKEEIDEKDFKEVDLVALEEKERKEKEAEEKKRAIEEKRILAERAVAEKIEKKEIPSIHELAERKKKIEEVKKEEEKIAEVIAEIEDEAETEEETAETEEKVSEQKEERADISKKKEEVSEEKGFFSSLKEKLTTKTIDEKQFEEMFWNLEIVLLENNVAVEVIDKIKEDLKKNIVDVPIKRGQVKDTIFDSLKDTMTQLFDVVENVDFISKVKSKKPFVICFVGINGSGKTTTIAKVARLLQDNGLKCVLAAADTFRAAAIDQLQKHSTNLGVKLIRQDYGSDAAAVAFDAVKHASAKGIDVVLIDTAGRMHSNTNLMEEMEKIIRVAKPDMKIFVGESITGNDCTEQAKSFNESIGIDGIILSKADVDEKGGAAISVSYVTGKPILFIGTGQNYTDLQRFDKNLILKSLGF